MPELKFLLIAVTRPPSSDRTGTTRILPEWKKVTAEDNWTMIIDKECRCVAHHDDELAELHNEVGPGLFKLNLTKE